MFTPTSALAKPLFDRDFVFCDFETTGVDPDTDAPIEIGLVHVDRDLNVVATYEALISDAADATAAPVVKVMRERDLPSYRVHRIPDSLRREKGRSAARVASEIIAFVGPRKPVLISDNIQFEWRFMAHVLRGSGVKVEDVFHYCGWDTSLLLDLSGVGDPENLPHRALPDAFRVYRAVVQAAQAMGKFAPARS